MDPSSNYTQIPSIPRDETQLGACTFHSNHLDWAHVPQLLQIAR